MSAYSGLRGAGLSAVASSSRASSSSTTRASTSGCCDSMYLLPGTHLTPNGLHWWGMQWIPCTVWRGGTDHARLMCLRVSLVSCHYWSHSGVHLCFWTTAAHSVQAPVWPVVSMPAKKSAATSGSICCAVRRAPERGSLVWSNRSAKEPGVALMDFTCSRRPLTSSCSLPHHFP